MRKILITVLLTIIIMFLPDACFLIKHDFGGPEIKVHAVSNDFEEQPYKGLFVTMLYPYVNAAIDEYYSEYMTYLPGEAPYAYNFINIEKTPGMNYSYTVVLEVLPYVGPHISVGRDRITFKIELSGVKLEKFEHLESHKLPSYYKNMYKKELPEFNIME